jgi:putative SOS response-associated peptidase YedK
LRLRISALLVLALSRTALMASRMSCGTSARLRHTFAVITVPANELIAPIHDRMLAILQNNQFPRWLSDETDPRNLLVPFPADQLAVSLQRSRR